jgi:hypothetical protein
MEKYRIRVHKEWTETVDEKGYQEEKSHKVEKEKSEDILDCVVTDLDMKKLMKLLYGLEK